jgi:hypothetical protein
MSLKETLRACTEQHKRIVAAAKRGKEELRATARNVVVFAAFTAGVKHVVEGYPYFIDMGWRCRIDGVKIALAYYIGFCNDDRYDNMKRLGREVAEAFMANIRNVRRDKALTERFCMSYRNFMEEMDIFSPPSDEEFFDGFIEYILCACDWHNKGYTPRISSESLEEDVERLKKWYGETGLAQLKARGFGMNVD